MINNTNILAKRLPVFGVAVIMAFALSNQGFAQTAPAPVDPNTVLVTVGDDTITEGDLAYAAEDLSQELANVPPQQQRTFLTSVLIDMRVMAKAARAADLQNSEVFKRRLKYLEDRSLRRAYFSEKIANQVTPEAIQTAYDKIVADFKPQEEVRARHILVASEEDAKSIRAEIEAGKPFETAASEKSTDGSAQNGGDLGYFARGQMVGPFEDAAFALKVGEVSQPVQSQFGWHLIKLEDRRQSAAPTLQQIEPQLRQQVLIEAFNAEVQTLKAKTEVSVKDPEIAAALATEEAKATGAAK